jgi:hypothetical protein
MSCLLLLLVLQLQLQQQQKKQLVDHHIIAADQNLPWNKKLKAYTTKNKFPHSLHSNNP